MAILIYITDRNTASLHQLLHVAMPQEVIYDYRDHYDPKSIEVVLAWKHPAGSLTAFPNLKFIASYGAGVDHFLQDKQLPEGIPITRIVSNGLIQSMKKYVLTAVLSFHKRIFHHYHQKKSQVWDRNISSEQDLKIGVLGLGQLGQAVALELVSLGFEVSGYSLSPKHIEEIACFNSQEHTLSEFLEGLNALICLLPLNSLTRGILNQSVFNRLRAGSLLVNVGRGAHLVEEDLLVAIQSGKIAEAWLDVFQQEPLPKTHPFWKRSEIIITPHVAAETPVKEAVEQFAENIRRMRKGEALLFLVDPKRGY